jgi:hypothetical protein
LVFTIIVSLYQEELISTNPTDIGFALPTDGNIWKATDTWKASGTENLLCTLTAHRHKCNDRLAFAYLKLNVSFYYILVV